MNPKLEESVQELFEGYRQLFLQALDDSVDMDQLVSSYASAFIAASPAGVMIGENDEKLKEIMKQGFKNYREIGTKDMQLRNVHIVPIDDLHCVAQVAWSAIYDRGKDPDVTIDFDVHYLVQQINNAPKIFGWISGDEQAVLKEHGII